MWKPEDYGGIRTINLPPTHIWTPDIELYNRHAIVSRRSILSVTPPPVGVRGVLRWAGLLVTIRYDTIRYEMLF